MKKFFRPGNINALRELALRYTAKKVDDQLEGYMRVNGIAGPWPTGEKVLVCISASPFSAKLIRIAKRMATSQNAEWLAVNVEPTLHRLSRNEAERDSMAKNLRLAETLGAKIIGLTGDNIAEEILELVRKRNVSQIIIGKPQHTRFWNIIHNSVVDKVIRHSQGISIHVIPGSQQEAEENNIPTEKRIKENDTASQHRHSISFFPYIVSFVIMVMMTLVLSPINSFLGTVNILMLFLLPVLISASRWGRLPAVITAAMGVIIFDFYFVPPIFTFRVADNRYLLSFTIFMLVALMTGTLSDRLKKQVKYSRQRASRVSALYALSRDIAAVDKLDAVLESIATNVAGTLDGQVVLLLPDENARLVLKKDSGANNFINDSELAVASWVFDRGQKAGKGTETLGGAAALYIPLCTEQGVQGVLGICFNETEAEFDPERVRLLEAFVGLAAMAINRITLAEQARQALTMVESERLRTALFDSLSHDLRTPLSSIVGAVTGLLEDQTAVYSPEAQQDLLQIILNGAERMNRFISNLLDMARLESGMLKLKTDWCDLQDIIGVAVTRLGGLLTNRPLDIKVQPALPMVQADCILIEQVLINLLDNALKYSKQGSRI